MEFRLLYQGELESSGNKSAKDNKHKIRRAIHPQLRTLWRSRKNLQQFASSLAPRDAVQERIDAGIDSIAHRWPVGKYLFVPLITPNHAVRCSLDILLLRPEDEDNKKWILNKGDVDGQVKTLFDALRIPTMDELPTTFVDPQPDESPFYCLLSDDRLISEVRVNADQLLLLPNKTVVDPTDSFVVIHVKLSHRYGGAVGRFFD